MSNKAINWAFEQTNIRNSEKMVLVVLANSANQKHQCWPSHERIAKQGGLAVSTVRQALVSLKEKGLIDWQQRLTKDGVTFDSNLYTLPIKKNLTPPPNTGDDDIQRRQISDAPTPVNSTPPSDNWSYSPPVIGEKPKDEPKKKPKGTEDSLPSFQIRAGNRVGKVFVIS